MQWSAMLPLSHRVSWWDLPMGFFLKTLAQRDLRKSERHLLHYPACIDPGDGSLLVNCMIFDVSEGGARLTVGMRAEVPEEFDLVFRRRCRVLRRADGQIAVTFLHGACPA
jgi:PilZ domain